MILGVDRSLSSIARIDGCDNVGAVLTGIIRKPSRLLPPGLSRGLALCGLLAIVWVTWLAASPEAHQHLHADACSEQHVCAVTLFAQETVPLQADAFLVLRVTWATFDHAGLCETAVPATNPSAFWRMAAGPPKA